MWNKNKLLLLISALALIAVRLTTAERSFSSTQQARATPIHPSIRKKAGNLSELNPADFKFSNKDDVPTTATSSIARGGGADTPSTQQLAGVVVFALIEVAFRKLFKANGIRFPGQLAGCVALFVFMILAQIVSPGLGDVICNALSPGSGLLAKWVGVFFVPGLTMLPLAPSIGSPFEVRMNEAYRQTNLFNFKLLLLYSSMLRHII